MDMSNPSIATGLAVALLGVLMVFVVLLILIAVIVIQNKVISAIENKGKAPAGEAAPAAAAAPAAPPALAKGSCGACMLHDVPDRTAAMIMAIVADELKTPLNELRFISIQEVK